jgi:hypothetical protein
MGQGFLGINIDRGAVFAGKGFNRNLLTKELAAAITK